MTKKLGRKKAEGEFEFWNVRVPKEVSDKALAFGKNLNPAQQKTGLLEMSLISLLEKRRPQKQVVVAEGELKRWLVRETINNNGFEYGDTQLITAPDRKRVEDIWMEKWGGGVVNRSFETVIVDIEDRTYVLESSVELTELEYQILSKYF